MIATSAILGAGWHYSDKSPLDYCSLRKATLWPFRLNLMGEADETDTGLGPVEALVDESMISSLALVNEPNAPVSIEISAVNPAPLLSVGEATAWFEIMTTAGGFHNIDIVVSRSWAE